MAAVQWNTCQAWRPEDLQCIKSTRALDDQSCSEQKTFSTPVYRDELEGSRFSGHRTRRECDDVWERNGVKGIVLIARWGARL